MIANNTSFIANNTATYILTGTDNNACVNTDTLQLVVNPLPSLTVNQDIQICFGESVTLTAISNGVFQWSNGIMNDVPFQPQSTNTYTISSVSSFGCINSDQVIITVNPIPVANFATPFFVQGSPNTTFDFTNTSINGDFSVWEFGDGIGTSIINNPTYTYPLPSGSYPVQLIITSIGGCIDSITQIVQVINNSMASDLIIPTGFSPNNDASNDFWTITGIEKYPEAKIYVFNRWGQKIFDGNTLNATWDGTFNGEYQPIADYYFSIELNSSTSYNGVVTLKY
jgi:gliding motility-associated-like protein